MDYSQQRDVRDVDVKLACTPLPRRILFVTDFAKERLHIVHNIADQKYLGLVPQRSVFRYVGREVKTDDCVQRC